MLKIENIKKSFGGIEAVRDSTFVIRKNTVTALIGPNGAGKTTLFDIICGLITPDSGRIIFEGKDLGKLRTHERINMGISRTFQQVRLFKYLSIRDHLQMVLDHNDMKILRNIIYNFPVYEEKHKNILRNFGITHDLEVLAGDLSYGQRKLLDIALALNKKHKLLMLDEPVAGVNNFIQKQIEDLLLNLKKFSNETILLIDHDMEFVRKLADYVIVLDSGAVLVEGAPDDVFNDEKVLEAYLGK